MGTRSLTVVRSKWDEGDWEVNAVIYRHWEGYLEGHGQWLFDFLDGMVVINGIPGDPPPKFANGPGRLAAQIVAGLQEDGHSPDLMPSVCDCGQEFHYQIDVPFGMGGGEIQLTVFGRPMAVLGLGGSECNQIFQGTVAEFDEFLSTPVAEEE